MNPRVSIITPSLNQGAFIEDAILSVLNQTYSPIEYMVIDGGSTDRALSVLDKYKRNLLLISEKDKGQSDAINKGMRLATGDLIGWLNSDDALEVNAVESIVERFHRNPNASIYFGATRTMDERGTLKEVRRGKPLTFNTLLKDPTIPLIQPASFYPRHLLERVGYLDSYLFMAMDRDLFLKLLKIAPAEFIPEFLARTRAHKETKSFCHPWIRLREHLVVLRRHGAPLTTLLLFASSVLAYQLKKSWVRS